MTIDYRIRNIVIAAALAAAAVLLTVVYVTSARNNTATGKQSVTVYVPSKDFAAGTAGSKITGSLTSETLARKYVAPDAVTNPAQIKALYLTQPVYAGEQLSLKRFALPSEQGIRSKLTGVQRAMQVPGTSDQLLDGTLVAGDRVDVVANLKDPQNSSIVKSSVVLRDLRVLDTEAGSGGSKISSTSSDQASVILAVTDEQAQRLFYVMKNGDWALQLRAVKKPQDSGTSNATFSSVLAGGAK